MAQIDKALGTTDIDPVLGKIKAAKTPQETIDIGADIAKGGYEADVAKIRAEQRKAEKLPAIERQLREEEGKYLTGAQERERKTIDEAEMAMQNFKVSKETPYGMAALASVIGVLGQIAGRTGGNQAALGAIKSMTGMMQGYQQGRADIFRREQIEFDKNFKLMQNKIDKARKEFDRAVALMPYNMAKAREVAEVAKAELNSPIVDALVKKQGYVAAQTLLTQASNSIQKEADRAQQLNVAQAKSQGSKGGAANARYAFNIAESFGQAATDVLNVAQMPKGTVLGMFADLAGKSGDSYTQSLKTTLGRKLTKEDERMMQIIVSGLEANMSRALGGGYAQSGAKYMIDIYKQQVPKAGDPPIVTAIFLARIKQELGILAKAFSAHPGATEGYVDQMKDYMNAMNKAIPFDVSDVIGVRRGERQTISQQSEKIVNAPSRVPLPVAPGTQPSATPTTVESKPMPTGEKLKSYANQYFNGNIEDAKRYLTSQGYRE